MKRFHLIASVALAFGLLLSACQTTASERTEQTQNASPTPVQRVTQAPITTDTPTIAPLKAVSKSDPEPDPEEAAPVAAATPTAASIQAAPPAPATDFGLAPEINAGVWLNADAPLRLADLCGRVAIIEFWTYG